ncbi:phage tail protein [Candidatus Margulisiibacteriota bacterium]
MINKKMFLILIPLIILLSVSVFAAAPKLLNFQGRLINKDTGDPIAGAQTVIFELYDAAPLGSGTKVWDQTISNVGCDSEGIFSVVLGGGAISLDTVNFDQELWMQITYGSQIFDPRQRLTMVPYAFQAVSAETANVANTAYSVAGSAGVPIGTILPFAGSAGNIPTNYVSCEGQLLNQTEYNELYVALGSGTIYGTSGSDFYVPDYRGQFLRGWDNGKGDDPDVADRTNPDGGAGVVGDIIGSRQGDAFQGHVHTYVRYQGNPSGWELDQAGNNSFNLPINTTGPVNDGTHGAPRVTYETRPKNVYVMYIMRAK